MDLHALKIFKTVAETGSITEAAKSLNYAQSNVTTKIKQLEKEMETTLFYRHNRGTTLTVKGKILLSYTEKIFRLFDETVKVMKADDEPRGPLSIGAMETTAAVRLPRLLSNYHHKYPRVDLALKTGPTQKCIQRVLEYELDGAFVAGPVEHPDLIQKKVIDEELVLVTAAAQPALAALRDIQDQTLLVFRTGCSYRRNFEEWFRHEGIIPKRIMEFDSLDAILGCVFAGLGISLLPLSVIEKHAHAGRLKCCTIPEAFAKVKTVFIYRKDSFISPALTKFAEMFAGEEGHLLMSPITA